LGDFVSNNLAAMILVLAGLGLVAMLVMQALQIANLKRRVDQLTGGAGEGNLEDVLIQHLESVHAMGQDLDELIARTAFLESSARHHYSHQGLVRFNPFPDTGGNQSFALALLDESENGFIISSLHSRTGTRIYAKVVTGGKTETTLSAEETQAIDEARAQRPARAAAAPAKSRASSAPREPAAARSAAAPKELPTSPAAQSEPVKAAAPAPAKTAPVVAGDGADQPAAAVVEAAAEGEPVHESTNRNVSAKGQSKNEALAIPEAGEDDAEKTGSRPGRHPGGQPSPTTRTE
jgi:hypothetical protein